MNEHNENSRARSDLSQHQRLLFQTPAQIAAGVHAEVLHHHLVDQLLQLTQLGTQMSEGHTHWKSAFHS